MHGFGTFFFIIGVLVLLFSPVLGVLLMILAAIMMGFAALTRRNTAGVRPEDHLIAARDRISPQEAARRRRGEPPPEQRIPCPHCAELILKDAKVCRFCDREVPLELERRVR